MTGTIRLGSKRKNSRGKPTAGETAIDIDRVNPILGNKHYLFNHFDSTERAKVIGLYEQDLISDEKINGPMTQAIKKIAQRVKNGENIICMCWCAPEFDCHGRHIIDRVNKINNE